MYKDECVSNISDNKQKAEEIKKETGVIIIFIECPECFEEMRVTQEQFRERLFKSGVSCSNCDCEFIWHEK